MESRKRRIGVVESPDTALLQEKRFCLTDEQKNDDVCQLLRDSGFNNDVCRVFIEHKIEYHHLTQINTDMLIRMGICSVGTQLDLLKFFSRFQKAALLGNEKVFNDPIHGHIELHPLLVKVIDTPQFQRLRHIKQLGGGYYVFPGASHNRFEHSIGVSYLAGEFIESLDRKQPELNITMSDILCIKLAALCHDLGHGPFSHMFDQQFIPKLSECKEWKHEEGSVDMLKHLLNENDLRSSFKENGLNDDDLIFIEELIYGPHEELSLEWNYKGRPMEKSFLYEIVANKRNGIDVDKWDYFARDCHCLGIPNNFDWKRYIKFARVIEVNGIRQICCRDKEVTNLYEMFHTRTSLHRRAYKHKTSNIVEHMITEALLAANNHISLCGKDGKSVKISECIKDMYAYTRLNDSIVHTILQSTDPELTKLTKSRNILHQLEKRKLYKCIGQTQPSAYREIKEEDICQQIVSCSTPEDDYKLSTDDIIVKVVTFDYGMKDKNPIDEMRFYTKDRPNRAVRVRKDQVSQMLPHTFIEKSIRVYCKKLNPEALSTALNLFLRWCNKQDNMIVPKDELSVTIEDDDIQFTPYGTPFGTPLKEINAQKAIHSELSLEHAKKRLSFSIQDN